MPRIEEFAVSLTVGAAESAAKVERFEMVQSCSNDVRAGLPARGAASDRRSGGGIAVRGACVCRRTADLPDGLLTESTTGMMERGPGARVLLFEESWSRVDAVRDQIAARGLGERIAVHHADALQWLPRSLRSQATTAARFAALLQ